MTGDEATPLDPQVSRPKRTRLQSALREILKAPITAKFGILVILVYGFVAIFAPVLTPYSETEIVGPEFDVWGEEFILGTDGLGRDMLTRLLFGARNTVGIAFFTTVLAFLIGGLTGLLAAIYSGWFDQIAGRVVDVLMAIPQLIFALMLLTIFGTSIPTLIIVIATLDATRIFRVTRAVSLNVVVLDYFEAARLRGERLLWLCIREVLPNITAPLMAEFGLRFCFCFSDDCRAEFSRPGHSTSHRRLGFHGAGKCGADYLRRYHTHPTRHCHCYFDPGC